MAVDISRMQKSALEGAIRNAKDLQASGDLGRAVAAWRFAATQAEHYANSASTPAERQRRLATAQKFQELALALQPKPQLADGGTEPLRDEFRESARRLILRSKVRLEDLVGLDDTVREIQSAFAQSMAQAPEGVEVPKLENILLYGPPGCGKTLLAAAISNTLDATFFAAKVSDLLSKYYGESPKMVQALYDEAREQQGGIIFLDEFDVIGSSRTGGENASDKKVLISLLTELDGIQEKGGSNQVFTLAATNRPWDLDNAAQSRFEKKIFIPLPNAPAREQLVNLQLQGRGYTMDVTVQEIVEKTEGFSGRDMLHLCKSMVQQMIADANPQLVSLAAKGREAIANYTLQVAPISYRHWQFARSKVKPRTSPAEMAAFEKYAENCEES